MDTIRKSLSIALTAIAILTTACKPDVVAQNPQAGPVSYTELLKRFADQPDHKADRIFIINDFSFKIRFAKKQGKTRQELYVLDDPTVKLRNQADRTYKIIVITQLGQPSIAYDPQERTYAELPEAFKAAPLDVDNMESLLKTAAPEIDKLKAQDMGIVNIDGHQATKIKVSIGGESEGFTYFYFARDLNNLFIKMEGGGKYWEGSEAKMLKGSMTLSEISLEVPEELFQLPADYKRISFESMKSTIEGKIQR
jgi:hypothetical protein